jgi:hypothetical protein
MLDAKVTGHRSPPSRALISAPINIRMDSGVRDDNARCRGDEWFPSSAFKSAPCSIKSCIVLVFPRDDARCKGALRFPSSALTSAPLLINSRVVLEPREDDARCKGVE